MQASPGPTKGLFRESLECLEEDVFLEVLNNRTRVCQRRLHHAAVTIPSLRPETTEEPYSAAALGNPGGAGSHHSGFLSS